MEHDVSPHEWSVLMRSDGDLKRIARTVVERQKEGDVHVRPHTYRQQRKQGRSDGHSAVVELLRCLFKSLFQADGCLVEEAVGESDDDVRAMRSLGGGVER
jgi:hypothetical protein